MTKFNFPVIDFKATGKNIESLRTQKGLSVIDVKKALCLASTSVIYRWQWGETLPTIDNLVGLSALFDVPIDQILVLEKQKDGNKNPSF